LVRSHAEKAWLQLAECDSSSVKLNLQKFLAESPAVKVELVRRSLNILGSGERDLTRGHFKRVLQLAEQRIGNKRIELPGGFVVCYGYGELIFARPQKDLELEERTGESVSIEVPGKARFGQYLIEATVFEAEGEGFGKFKAEKSRFVEWFDLDKVKPPLVVRLCRAGDRFWPLGLPGEKKIGKFLTAARVPQRIRKKTLIVADSEKIIWLWPIRVSKETKIAGRTLKILQLRIIDMASA